MESLHLGFHALQDVVDRRRIGEPLPYGCQDGIFGCPTGHEQFVLTGAANGGETAVVPAALAAHLADGTVTLPAVERSRQQVRGIGLDVAALPSLSGLWSAPQWPPRDRPPSSEPQPAPRAPAGRSATPHSR